MIAVAQTLAPGHAVPVEVSAVAAAEVCHPIAVVGVGHDRAMRAGDSGVWEHEIVIGVAPKKECATQRFRVAVAEHEAGVVHGDVAPMSEAALDQRTKRGWSGVLCFREDSPCCTLFVLMGSGCGSSTYDFFT